MRRRWPIVSRFAFHPRHVTNRLRQFLEYARGDDICRSWPTFITLELSSVCNLDCRGCPHTRMTRRRGNMDPSLFKHILDQVKGRVEVIDLDLFGEFTFNPHWREMVAYARDHGFFTVLNTTATRLDEETIDALVEARIDYLNFSFTGTTPEQYEAYQRGGSYAKTLSAIHRFLERNKTTYTVVQMIRTTETQDQIDEYLRLWRHARVDAVRVKEYLRYDPAKEHLDPRPLAAQKRRQCIFPWRTLVVAQDGAVVPCCVDYDKKNVLGDATKQTIEDIWNDTPLRSLREKHASGRYQEVPLCTHCRPVTAPPLPLFLSFLADDATRRKLLPYAEAIGRSGIPLLD